MSFDTTGLGSLAQSARKKELKSARGILLGFGVMTLILNLLLLLSAEVNADKQIEKEVQEAQRKGLVIDKQKLAEMQRERVRLEQLYRGGLAILGAVFVVCGLTVDTFPVPITIASLVLFVGYTAVFALMRPEILVQGLFFKIVIIVALAKSVQVAVVYERERALQQGPAPQF